MKTRVCLKENRWLWKSRSEAFGSRYNHFSKIFCLCVPFSYMVMVFSGFRCRCVCICEWVGMCPVTVTEFPGPFLGKQDSWENQLELVSLAHIKELPWRRIAVQCSRESCGKFFIPQGCLLVLDKQMVWRPFCVVMLRNSKSFILNWPQMDTVLLMMKTSSQLSI